MGILGKGWPGEFLRYGMASIMALAVDAGTLYAMTEHLGIYYLFSAIFGFVLGMITIYLLSVRWVFIRRSVKDRRKELIIFVSVGLVGMLINEVGIYMFTEIAGFYYILSKLAVTGFVFLWNFGARKWLLFR